MHLVGLVGVLEVEVEVDGASVPRDDGILGGVDRNPVKPRIEGAVASELRQSAIRLDKSFLGEVLVRDRGTFFARELRGRIRHGSTNQLRSLEAGV